MTNDKLWQAAYYLKNRERLRKRHREHARKVRLGLIIPKHRQPEVVDEWKQSVCGYCGDTIFGRIFHLIFNGRKINIDNGCYLMAMAGRFRAGEVVVDKSGY